MFWATYTGDDQLRGLTDQILSEPRAPRRRRRVQTAITSAPAEPAVHTPRETPQDLIDVAIAHLAGDDQVPVLEPLSRPPAKPKRACEVVCMLCSRAADSVATPIRNQRCGHCGFRSLVRIDYADMA
jgi:hypothetical protein